MLITKESDYAIRIIRALADGACKSVKKICEQENIPLQFAYKITKKLEKAGIIRSYRGTKGGYTITADINELTLFDVFIAIEENLNINCCMDEGFNCPNDACNAPCLVREELYDIQKAVIARLRLRPFSEILDRSPEKGENQR